MTDVVFYFQCHQPFRLRHYTWLDVGASDDYFDAGVNEAILHRVAERCYLPMNAVLREKIAETDGAFRCAFALTGTLLRQLEQWEPEVIDSFRELVETGSVELVCETSHHSLCFDASPREFELQVKEHRSRLRRLFGVDARTFRNTELIFDEALARRIERLGFEVLLAEGADFLLDGRSPHHVYGLPGCRKLKLLLRDYVRSDDIAFRFSNREWTEHPLMADTFAGWLHALPQEAELVGLFMDYETFGEHQWAETGILEFMRALPARVLEDERFRFATPLEAARPRTVAGLLRTTRPISWADAERDLSAWRSNPMQVAAHEALYELEADARRAVDVGHPEMLETWRRLSTSDHVYYMATKWASDGDVHEYFSHYDSPHEAFVVYMNVLEDFGRRLRAVLEDSPEPVPTTDEKSE